jgi:hypothetical protein
VIREFKSPQLITAQGEAVNKDIKKYIDWCIYSESSFMKMCVEFLSVTKKYSNL